MDTNSHSNRRIWTPLIGVLILALGLVGGVFLQPYIYKAEPLEKYIIREDPIDEIITLIKQEYVDSVNRDSLYLEAVNGVLKKLDPHTVYIPSSQLEQANELLEGSGKGIGIDYFFLNDTLLVTSVDEGGPAEKANLRIGDKIINVNGQTIAGDTVTERRAVDAFRKSASDSLNLLVQRKQSPELLKVNIIKGTIKRSSVIASYMLEDGVTGYIKMSIFSASAYNDFTKAVTTLQEKGMQQLVYDLRGNTGGYLEEAVAIADELLSDDKLIVVVKSKNENEEEYKASIAGDFEKGALVILIDEMSASASEIVAGAVQDWDRGVLIGQPSFGKGLVQEQYQLSDGSAIRLTTARYYTPTGRSIQRSYEDGKLAYNMKNYNRIYHIQQDSSISFHRSDTFRTFISKRPIYGGGGISPDIKVLDTSRTYSTHLLSFLDKGLLESFVNRYYFTYLYDKLDYKDFNEFNDKYTPQAAILKALKGYMELNDAMNAKAIWKNKRDVRNLKRLLKAQFATLSYGKQYYHNVLNKEDLFIAAATKALEKKKYKDILKYELIVSK